MNQFIHKRPWVLIVAAFLMLIGAWSSLIVIAVKNQPQKLELKTDGE